MGKGEEKVSSASTSISLCGRVTLFIQENAFLYGRVFIQSLRSDFAGKSPDRLRFQLELVLGDGDRLLIFPKRNDPLCVLRREWTLAT